MSEVLAVVAGKEITQEDFDKFMERVPENQRAYFTGPEAQQFYLDQLIEMNLFAAWAKEQKMDESEEYKKSMEDVVRDTLARMAMKKVFADIDATEDEMKAYYDANQDKFQKEAMVHAKHILVEDEQKCAEILEEIQKGEKPFEDAAASYSTCPSSAQGGDLGEFGRGRMVKEFEDAAFATEPGNITGPVKTQFGYHLIKVVSRKEADTAPFDDVKEHIYKDLMQQKQEKVYLAKVAELKEQFMAE